MWSKTVIFVLPMFFALASAQTSLTPHDLGLPPSGPLPPHLLTGCYNDDPFLDIARACGNRLEIYYFQDQGYPARPQAVKLFDQPLRCLGPAGDPWGRQDDIAVTLQDGSRQVFQQRGGQIDLGLDSGFLPPAGAASPPRQISDISFQVNWQSQSHPYGMDKVAVGDLDNDGITELATWWKASVYADTAWMLIYKSTGEDGYQLYMQEPINLYPDSVNSPFVTALLIDDIDQDGQKELIFSLQYCYFWEFSAPGVYRQWHSDFTFVRPVTDLKITDVNQNGIKEITQLGYYQYSAPQQSLMIREFWLQNAADSSNIFCPITDMTWECEPEWIYWPLFAAGDYDNNNITEIVLGIAWGISSWPDSWVRCFRYAPGAPNNFAEYWMAPGIWATCSNPLIADFDHDARQELYAAGFGGYSPASNGSGSAYLWKSSGPDSGRAVWWDTTSMIYAPSGTALTEVDSTPGVLNNIVSWLDGQFCLFGFPEQQPQLLWQSQLFSNTTFTWPIAVYQDQGKTHFATGEHDAYTLLPNKIRDWEQTTSGIGFEPAPEPPADFTLYPPCPNPFNGSTQITYDLPALSEVRLSIYDLAGRLVLDQPRGNQSLGRHTFTWTPGQLASGIYWVVINTAAQQHIQKVVLVK